MIDLNEIGFKFAFTLRDYYTFDVLNNTGEIQLVTRLETFKDNTRVDEYDLKTHQCNESDWNDFHPFTGGDVDMV